MIRQAFKDLSRLREIAVVAARHGFGEVLDRPRLWEVLGRKEKHEVNPESQRESAARRFRKVLSELGPTYIKLGQILSTRADVLPREYVQELALLQDAVPPEPIEHVLKQIESSFGRPLQEIFESFDETPLASASIAQVHKARTHEGQDVVVKVQRPGIRERIRADLDLLYYAAKALEAVFEETGLYTPTGIIEEFDQAVHEELDFLNEARNLREFAQTHAKRPRWVIPKVYDQLTTPTVLTMECLHGEKIRTADITKHDRVALAETLVDDAFRQLFEDGLFHGDPHPGNILLMEGDRFGLLDFGMVGRVSRSMQETLVLIVLAISLKDGETLARIIYRMATPDRRTNLAAFVRDIQSVLDSHLTQTKTLGQIDAKQLVPEVLNMAVRYHIRIPKEYAILSRAAIAIEGIIRWLHPNLQISQFATPYAKELLIGRYESTGLSTAGVRALLRVQAFATEVPTQLSQILLDLEGGKFRVNIGSEELTKVEESLKRLGVILFIGFVACGLTVGAFLSFSRVDTVVAGIPVLGVLAMTGVAFLFGVVFSWTMGSGKVRKISLDRWIKRLRRRKLSS